MREELIYGLREGHFFQEEPAPFAQIAHAFYDEGAGPFIYEKEAEYR